MCADIGKNANHQLAQITVLRMGILVNCCHTEMETGRDGKQELLNSEEISSFMRDIRDRMKADPSFLRRENEDIQ